MERFKSLKTDREMRTMNLGMTFGSESSPARRFTISLLLAGFVLQLSGCATKAQLSPETHEHYRSRSGQLQKEKAAVIGDGCVLYSGLTGSYAYLNGSTSYATRGVEAYAAFLRERKVPVSETLVPFVCGSLHDTNELTVTVDEHSDREVRRFPVFGSEAMRSVSQAQVNAYLALLRQAAEARFTRFTVPLAEQEATLELAADDARMLQKSLKARYVFVVSLGGAQVSGGKRFAAAALSGVATFALTGGSMFMTMVDTATSESVTMIDLQQRRVLWKNGYSFRRQDPLVTAYNVRDNGILSEWAPSVSRPFIFPVELLAQNTQKEGKGEGAGNTKAQSAGISGQR
jgi:hypothetical protein